MLHNNSALTAFSTIPNSTVFQKTLGVNDYYYGDGEWDFPLGAMQMLGRSDADTIRLNDPNGAAGDPEVLGQHSLDFWITTEDLARWDNRVVAGADGSIRLEYTPSNLRAHERLIDKFKGLLATMQCRDDVIFAQSYANGETPCIGRWAALVADLPIEVPGTQVDRRCGSGLQAVVNAASAGTGSAPVAATRDGSTSAAMTRARPARSARRSASP